MSSLMDRASIKRRCYLNFGDGTVMSFIRLRADCFFREEGYVRAVALASHPHRWQISGARSEVGYARPLRYRRNAYIPSGVKGSVSARRRMSLNGTNPPLSTSSSCKTSVPS
jgi:hypothetical protein